MQLIKITLILLSHIKPSHQEEQFGYLMKNTSEWTDLVHGDLSPDKGNFHSYSHKVIYTTMIKSSQGGYRDKMGIPAFPAKDVDYTLCIEILNTDYQLWHKSRISIDKATSKGLSIGNVAVKNSVKDISIQATMQSTSITIE